MNLKCKELRCKYNKNLNCTAKNINVGESTECQTFMPISKISDEDYEKHLFDKKAELDFIPTVKNMVCVDCRAECLFNKKGKCFANGITVMQHKKNPICQTFIFK